MVQLVCPWERGILIASILGAQMGVFAEVFRRTAALIILRVSGTFAGGSIAGVELWQAGAMAAFIGVMDVAENLSRAYMIDGKLDIDEINSAFGGQANNGQTAEEALPEEETGL